MESTSTCHANMVDYTNFLTRRQSTVWPNRCAKGCDDVAITPSFETFLPQLRAPPPAHGCPRRGDDDVVRLMAAGSARDPKEQSQQTGPSGFWNAGGGGGCPTPRRPGVRAREAREARGGSGGVLGECPGGVPLTCLSVRRRNQSTSHGGGARVREATASLRPSLFQVEVVRGVAVHLLR